MHCVLDVESASGKRGRLWLGGGQASAHTEYLKLNGITVVQPASRKPRCEESLHVEVLQFIDGTGLANGTEDLDSFLQLADALLERVAAGESVLSCCKNGAHRSATHTAILLMRWTGWDSVQVTNYLSSVRNIVDLSSVPRPNAQTRRPRKPEEFLKEHEAEILAGSWGRPGCNVLTLVMFRKKAQELGFECHGRARPKSYPKGYREPASGGWSSFEVVTSDGADLQNSSLESSESSGPDAKRPRRPSLQGPRPLDQVLVEDPGFDVIADELGTREARRAKLKAIVEDLQVLDEKLVETMVVKKEKDKDKAKPVSPEQRPAQAPDADMAAPVEPAPEQEAEAAAEAEAQGSAPVSEPQGRLALEANWWSTTLFCLRLRLL